MERLADVHRHLLRHPPPSSPVRLHHATSRPSCLRQRPLVQAKLQNDWGSFNRQNHKSRSAFVSDRNISSVSVLLLPKLKNAGHSTDFRWIRINSTTDSDNKVSETSETSSASGANTAVAGNEFPSSNVQPVIDGGDQIITPKGTTPKRAPLTAREKLRAARVMSKYTDTKPSQVRTGNKVLDALRESEGGKKKSGLPEAPSNLFDDSKRGMPKKGLTFSFPGGNDLLIIAFSFVFISTVMFATTYFVWKVGAIHFNEY